MSPTSLFNMRGGIGVPIETRHHDAILAVLLPPNCRHNSSGEQASSAGLCATLGRLGRRVCASIDCKLPVGAADSCG
jgi:hypothetical protein